MGVFDTHVCFVCNFPVTVRLVWRTPLCFSCVLADQILLNGLLQILEVLLTFQMYSNDNRIRRIMPV